MDWTQRIEDALSRLCAVPYNGCLAVGFSAPRYRASSRHVMRLLITPPPQTAALSRLSLGLLMICLSKAVVGCLYIGHVSLGPTPTLPTRPLQLDDCGYSFKASSKN